MVPDPEYSVMHHSFKHGILLALVPKPWYLVIWYCRSIGTDDACRTKRTGTGAVLTEDACVSEPRFVLVMVPS